MGFYHMFYYIKIGSITNAQRARSVLHAKSINSQIRRLENPKPGDGCGYVIKVEDEDSAVSALRKAGLRILGVEAE